MGNDPEANTSSMKSRSVASRVSWHAGGPPGRSSWRSWLGISLAVFSAAALTGCVSGRAVNDPTGPAVSTTAGPTSAGTGVPVSPDGTGTGACVTSAVKGSCGPYHYLDITNSDGQNTYVGQNVWNPIPGWSQTLHATDPGNWYVTAKMPARNTAVVSFPNTGQQYYYTNTVAGFTSIYSSFSENMHPASGTSAEAAYDIWLNNWGNEVMIQNDIVNRGTCPTRAVATFGGSGTVPVQLWSLCEYGSELIWQLSGRGEKSGTVDIRAMLTWLISHGYLHRGSSLTDISYGFEICSTGGLPETFTLSRFSIKAVGATPSA
jgi:hypothetical protein